MLFFTKWEKSEVYSLEMKIVKILMRCNSITISDRIIEHAIYAYRNYLNSVQRNWHDLIYYKTKGW
jgi:hypothetical protein